MKDELTCNNNNNKNNIFNYKGYFVENGREEEKKFYEHGAHFSYKELFNALMKIKLEKASKDKIMKIKPKKIINIERNNQKDKTLEEKINNIIKEFKIKNLSRNINLQNNTVSLNQKLNQNTFIHSNINNNINNNKLNINNKNYNNINKNINTSHVLNHIDSKMPQLNYKYTPSRNLGQNYLFEIPLFFTENKIINIKPNKYKINDINNTSQNKINDNFNLYKSYQNQVPKIREIKLNKAIIHNLTKNDLQNERTKISYNKRRIFSSNFDYLNKFEYKKIKLSPLRYIKTRNTQISGEFINPYNFNNLMKNSNYDNMTKQKYYDKYKKNINQRDNIFEKINSFSSDKRMRYISNSIDLNKTHHININITNNSNNNSKNISFKNRLNELTRQKKFFNKNMKINKTKLGNLSSFNEPVQKNKIQNLFKLLNKQEKMSRNKNINNFLNNRPYIHKTQQNYKDNIINTSNNTKNILNLKSLLVNKKRNKVKLANHLLYNTKNVTLNNINNKYINSNFFNNTTSKLQLNRANYIPKINTIQNKNDDFSILNVGKKQKKNNVNINININNNNRIIYNKIYEYKSPLNNINASKIIKTKFPNNSQTYIDTSINKALLRNVGHNIKSNKSKLANINNKNKYFNK